jgi:hypothetical protein
MNMITRSPSVRSTQATIFAIAVIVEPVTGNKERHSLTAYFPEFPFPFEIDQWAQSITGNDYRVIDSFLLEEISL